MNEKQCFKLIDKERIGDLLKDMPLNIESSGRGTIEKKKSLPNGIDKKATSGGGRCFLPEGITYKLSHYCQQLSENLDLIEQVKAEARENGIFFLHL